MKSVARKGEPDRRSHILDCTLDLIANQGVDSVTYRKVAEVAEIPLGSATYYFESREQLIREAFHHYLQKANESYDELRRGKTNLTEEQLVDYWVEVASSAMGDNSLLLAEYELTLFAARDPEIQSALHQWEEKHLATMAQMLEQAGIDHKPFDAAKAVFLMMRGHEIERLTRTDLDIEGFRRRLGKVVSAFK